MFECDWQIRLIAIDKYVWMFCFRTRNFDPLLPRFSCVILSPGLVRKCYTGFDMLCCRWVLCANHMEPVKGFLSRHLRRKLVEAEIETGHRNPDLNKMVDWMPQVWQKINKFLETHSSSDVTIGKLHPLASSSLIDGAIWHCSKNFSDEVSIFVLCHYFTLAFLSVGFWWVWYIPFLPQPPFAWYF